MSKLTENTVEYAAIDWLKELGYDYVYGGEIAPEEPASERNDYREVLLIARLRDALYHINDHIPSSARAGVVDDVIRKVQRSASQNLVVNNHAFHRLLVDGVDISFRDGIQMKHEKLWLLDFERPERNQWLAVNQFTIADINPKTRAKTERRPDIVLFVNGLPLVIFELKNLADEFATIEKAFHQFATYKDDIPTFFTYNALMVISDGADAKLGTITGGWEWFKTWRSTDGQRLDPHYLKLETLIKGVFAPEPFLGILRYFIVFEQDEAKLIKKVAAYHQYFAVHKAVENTISATHVTGNQRVGVIWHTQGSGKSLSMLFYAGKIIQHTEMANPTVVVLTDRNDLDDQLFGTFLAGQELLRQAPIQAEDREHLKQLLQVASGGVVFTTIQKFQPETGSNSYPLLSERRNIVFIADEAHRSQYGFDAHVVMRKDEAQIAYGFAKYLRDALPNASFIGFTGTPVESTDSNTREVFGDYIDIYDIQRAVDDGATVPIYYEPRLAKLRLREEQRPHIDSHFDEVTEGEEERVKESLKTKWSQLEAMVGTEERLAQVAADIVKHFEERRETLDGKGMIVAMSRRIAVDLYNQLIQLRPEWHDDNDDAGEIKVVMTGSASDKAEYQPHVRNKPRRKALAERFKDASDPLCLVIVRDMWLTGFDAPSLHTMYVDKPMQGHNLMQAIARVNRVFKDKPGGLIVDYLGIADDLQEAVQQYSANGQGDLYNGFDVAVDILLTEYGVVKAFFHRFDYSQFYIGTDAQRLSIIPVAMEHILKQPDGKKRYLDTVARLSKAYALAKSSSTARELTDEVAFFQAVRSVIVKTTIPEGRSQYAMENAVKQIVSQAVASEGIIDIFRSAGLRAPDVSILSDEFLEDVRYLEHKNLAIEALHKLLADQIRSRSRKNLIQARSFAEMLDATINRYQHRAIDNREIIEELIGLAKEMNAAHAHGVSLGLNDDEVAFYDALAQSSSAVEVMGDKQLAVIALELVRAVKANVSIDWTVRQGARAKIRVIVKRILRQYGYPPDLQEAATNLVLEQAELLAREWVQ